MVHILVATQIAEFGRIVFGGQQIARGFPGKRVMFPPFRFQSFFNCGYSTGYGIPLKTVKFTWRIIPRIITGDRVSGLSSPTYEKDKPMRLETYNHQDY